MIKYEIIMKAKNGDKDAIAEILEFYLPKIKKISNDDEYVQMALIEVYRGIMRFKNIKNEKNLN